MRWWPRKPRAGRGPAAPTSGASVTALDPFGYMPDVASRITGLRDGVSPEDRSHAFHTRYVFAPAHRLRFEGRFEELEADRGSLELLIHQKSPGSGASLQVVARRKLPLRTLARTGGAFATECVGRQGAIYALLGRLSPDAEARARGLDLQMLASGDPVPAANPAVTRIDPGDPQAALFSTAPATVAAPVSQLCTARQFDEPDYLATLQLLGERPARHRKAWEFVYIYRVLETYGCLGPGKRGLGFGVGREPLPAAMAAAGTEVVATDLATHHADAAPWIGTEQHIAGVEQLRRPGLCEDTALFARVSFRAVDMREIPSDLRGFDFTWSSCALEHLGSIVAGVRFIERSLDCLRPGGVAVHTTEFNLSSDDRTLDHAATVLFRRRDIAGLARRLVAIGHDVAPIKLDAGDQPLDRYVDLPPYDADTHLKLELEQFVTTSFGIVIRKRGGEAASGSRPMTP